MKKTKIILSLVVALTLGTNVQASDKSFGEIYTDCGIGGLLTAPIPEGVSQKFLAVVSNIVWDLCTTAISSNMSSMVTRPAVPPYSSSMIAQFWLSVLNRSCSKGMFCVSNTKRAGRMQSRARSSSFAYDPEISKSLT